MNLLQQIAELHAKGKTVEEISAELSISAKYIELILSSDSFSSIVYGN